MKNIITLIASVCLIGGFFGQTGYAVTGLNLMPNTSTTRCDTAITVSFWAQSAANNAQSSSTLPFIITGSNFVPSQFQFNISWGDGTNNTYNGGVSTAGVAINLNPSPAHTYPGPGSYTVITSVMNFSNQTYAVDTVVMTLGSCTLPIYSMVQVDCNNDGTVDSTLNTSVPLILSGSGQAYSGNTANNFYIFSGIEPGIYTLNVDAAWLAANNYTVANIVGPAFLQAGMGAQTVVITLNCGNGGNQTTSMCVNGQIYCDQDGNGQFNNGDIPIINAPVSVNYGSGTVVTYTNQQGNYSANYMGLVNGTASVSLNPNWLTQHGYTAVNQSTSINNVPCNAGVVPAVASFPINCGQNPGNPNCFSGYVFCDANGNNTMDPNELPLSFAPVILSTMNGNNNTVTVYTDSTGYFTYCGQIGNGQYIMAYIPGNYLTYLGYSVNFNVITLVANNNGMLPVNCGGNGGNTCADLWTTITPWIGYYQNSTAHIRLNWGNYGPSAPGPYTLTFTFPAGVTVNTASINTPGYTIAGNTITWNLNSALTSFSNNDIILFNIPGGLINGTSHYFTSTITAAGNIQDCNAQNNNGNLLQILGNSYDPNDKQVNRSITYNNNLFAENEIETGVEDILTYTIRFQNTGTAPAQNIVVVDTLDAQLDFASFSMVHSSHPVEVVDLGNGILHFEFNGIWLPDSTSNEPQSHGEFTYRIQENPNNGNGSEITNTAHIYFDWNAPIVTNTTYNINTWIENVSETFQNFKIYPNPNNGIVHVQLDGAFTFKLLDLNGRTLMNGNAQNESTLNMQSLANGNYILELNSNGEKTIARISKQ